MAARNGPLADTLNAIASVASSLLGGAHCAVLLLRSERITIAAARGLSGSELEALAGLSTAMLAEPPAAGEPLESEREAACTSLPDEQLALRSVVRESLKDFTFQPFISGAGELLGAFAICRRAAAPRDSSIDAHLAAIESVATLAIEHSNLLEELTYRAQHDSLTRIWNRLSFEDRLSRALAAARRTESRIGVLYLDLDHFRLINDVVGHQTGDALLRQVAERFQQNTRPSDIIARAGGDEFILLIPCLTRTGEARALGERLLASLETPFLIGDHELFVTASVGIGISRTEDVRVQDLESRAYTALEYAKRAGRNQVAVFDSSMAGASPQRLILEQRLRQALPNGELLMNYQPQIDLGTGRTTGVEALLRWKHPELGFVSPGTFIPIAEENGLICSFGEFALHEALHQHIAWRKEGLPPLRVGVNVSPLQFCRPDFARRCIDTIQEFELDPSQLEFEITEGVIMQNIDNALAHMNRLREIGVQFSVDDFGTGHSSLVYLQKLPVQRIKIDRAFVKDITQASERPPLVANIIRLAHAVGVPAIAEGIETLEQAIALTAMGCEEAQGYLFGKPLLGPDLLQWARRTNNTATLAAGRLL